MRLYEKIHRIRKAKGITQAELAARMHVSRQSVSNWELGTAVPSMDRLRELSKLLGVPVSCLLDDEQTVLAESAEDLENLPPPQEKTARSPVKGSFGPRRSRRLPRRSSLLHSPSLR